ncbi:MAG: universal stress protein [Rhizobiales bacterium]|nr:universal stress protein [Hyphomicrobiales bacterium]
MAHRLRKVFESGHRRKFLVVVDESPEFAVALTFAARVARRTGGSLVFLYVIEPGDFHHWMGVEAIRREEETKRARALFRMARMKLEQVSCGDLEPEEIIREGKKAQEIIELIEADEDIAILVLGASSEAEGPGPLVSSLAGKMAGSFPIPIYIVPGTLKPEDILALA